MIADLPVLVNSGMALNPNPTAAGWAELFVMFWGPLWLMVADMGSSATAVMTT